MSKIGKLSAITLGLMSMAAFSLPCMAGQNVTKQANFKNFTQVEASAAFELTITYGKTYSTVVHIDEELVPNLKMAQNGDTVVFSIENSRKCSCDGCMKVEINMPSLSGLKLSGAAQAKLVGFKKPTNLKLQLSGASAVNGVFAARKANFKMSGASSVNLKGTSKKMDLNASGACRVDLTDFPSNDVEVELNGAVSASVKATGTLNADCSGVSSLTYMGKPVLKRMHTSGLSTINKG
jgi:hypothetical protein